MGSYLKIEIFVPVSDVLGFSLIVAFDPSSSSSLLMKNIIHLPKRRSSVRLSFRRYLKETVNLFAASTKIHSGMN